MPRLPTKLDRDSAVVAPGGTTSWRLLIYNHSTDAADIVVQALGPLAAWVEVSPVPLVLSPRSEGSVEVVVTLPGEAPVPAGTHPVLLEARSDTPEAEPSLQELDVEVLRNTTASLTLLEEDLDEARAVYQARIDNGSNHPIRMAIEASARLPVDVDPPLLDVASFAAAAALVTVRRPAGDRRAVELTVRTTGDGLALEASTVTRSPSGRRPRGLPAWGSFAVAGLAAVVAAVLVVIIADLIRDGPAPRLEVTHQVPVGPSPLEVEFAFGSIWVTHADGQLWRIDPATASPVGGPIPAGTQPLNLSPSPTGDSLWIVDPVGRQLLQVDPRAAGGPAVTNTVPVDREVVDITNGGGVLWISALGEGEILRFDPGVRLDRWFTAMAGAADVAFVDGSVWGTDSDGRLVRIDPDVPGVQEGEIQLDGFPVAVLGFDGDVWVTVTADVPPDLEVYDDPAHVARIDPATGRLVARIPTPGRPWGLAAGDGVVWVVGRGVTDARPDGWVAAVDVDRDEIIAQLPLGFAPDGIAFDGDALWVADRPVDLLHRVELRGR